MIVLNLIITQRGFLQSVKSYYCNVASRSQIPQDELKKIESEYIKTIRTLDHVSEEELSDEDLLGQYGDRYFGVNGTDVSVEYSYETEQIWPL